ncbi:hypothetical protein K432DRAFT_109677 [Lepidopterella palustris CBS 459.81]|uniref:Uncharacterized protein n=1 Tax=Lepidopterella palustris CBS 459.81 TaxID=1314670 RepID=A0A8E2JCV8_9PEZI|nr:hypothetical protein K432DRAFT_109677 [Lepidopterella palustris CBS 459.81]
MSSFIPTPRKPIDGKFHLMHCWKHNNGKRSKYGATTKRDIDKLHLLHHATVLNNPARHLFSLQQPLAAPRARRTSKHPYHYHYHHDRSDNHPAPDCSGGLALYRSILKVLL